MGVKEPLAVLLEERLGVLHRRDLRARNKAGEAMCYKAAPNFCDTKSNLVLQKVGIKLVTRRENGFVAVFEIPRRALLRSSG